MRGALGNERPYRDLQFKSIKTLLSPYSRYPGGMPMAEFDKIRAYVLADRSQVWKDVSLPFYSYNRPGARKGMPATHKNRINAELRAFSKV